MPSTPETRSHPDWPEAIATVLDCHYDVRMGRAMAFGLPSSDNFRIRYNYYADGELHEGQFYSPTAVAPNTLFPIRYHPDEPAQHTLTGAPTRASGRGPLLALGVAGSVVLSLAWLAVLHGCAPGR